jgi:putative proteasome-type protease
MTYCVGLLLDQGLVMASDSRTNAGVDNIASYSKLHLFQPAPDRLFVLLAAGNLATTREVLDRIRRDLDQATNPRPSFHPPPSGPTLANANYLFEAADYIGQLSQAVLNAHGPALRQIGASPEATFILGGQVAGESPGLFLVYPQGNAIAASAETPYLQIGDSKFGKSALDLIAHPGLSLDDAARLCLVSLSNTARANLTVAPPFEIAIYPRDQFSLSHRLKLEADAPDLLSLTRSWEESQRRAFAALPPFAWEAGQHEEQAASLVG